MIRRVWLWGPVALVMAIIFVLSHQPVLPAPPGGLTDKQAHALVFGALAGLWYRALASGRMGGLTAARGVQAVIAAVLYGAIDEWHQSYIPERSADVADLMADATGAVIAGLIVWLCAIIAARRRSRAADPSHAHRR